MAPVVTTTPISLSSNKIQNGDILVPANPGSPGKTAVKMDRKKFQSFHQTIWMCSEEQKQTYKDTFYCSIHQVIYDIISRKSLYRYPLHSCFSDYMLD